MVDVELVVAEVPRWFAGVLELGADSFKEAVRGGVAELAAVLEDVQPTRGHFAARRRAVVVEHVLVSNYPATSICHYFYVFHITKKVGIITIVPKV